MIHNVDPQLNQWDCGRIVKVSDSNATHVHFANQGDSKAVIIEITNGEAKIPDYLLQTGKAVFAYAVLNGVTLESRSFSVRKRERPENYVYEDDQRNYIYALIANAETATNGANQAAENAIQAATGANTASATANLAAQNANNSANSANLAANNANNAADHANNVAKSLMVIGTARGNSIYLDDAIDQFLVGMRIFGKTTQDGVPTPEAPVALESVGDSGSVGVTVCGKNLFDLSGFEFDDSEYVHNVGGNASAIALYEFLKANAGKTVVISMTKTGTDSSSSSPVGQIRFYKDGALICILTPGVARKLEKLPDTFGECYIYGSSTGASVKDIQIEFGETPTAYEPYKGQTATYSTPNGLPGIPVTAGGNYTDVNGQQWICDEIDFARGVYIQRVSAVVLDGSTDELWALGTSYGLYQHYIAIQGAKVNSDVLNSAFQSKNRTIEDGYSFVGTTGRLSCFSSTINTADSWREYLSTTPITVYYILAEPITEALPDESVAAYAALLTYRGNTSVFNDAGAWMEIEYVMDARKYIDSQIAAGILVATLE